MLRARFQDDLKKSMIAKDQPTVDAVRLIIAALKEKDIAARSKGHKDGIGDDEILAMMQTMIKQRLESIKMYETGNRADLADREKAEIRVIEGYLPKQLSDEEVKAAIDAAIKGAGAASIKDMGKVMAELKARYVGQMDFAKASGFIKEKLSA